MNRDMFNIKLVRTIDKAVDHNKKKIITVFQFIGFNKEGTAFLKTVKLSPEPYQSTWVKVGIENGGNL